MEIVGVTSVRHYPIGLNVLDACVSGKMNVSMNGIQDQYKEVTNRRKKKRSVLIVC